MHYPDDPMNCEDVIAAIEQGDTELLLQHLFNRLEGPAFGKFPKLEALYREIIKLGSGGYRMTGSGSAFFLPVTDREGGLKEILRLASLRKLFSCDIVYCEGNVRGTSYGNYRSEVDTG